MNLCNLPEPVLILLTVLILIGGCVVQGIIVFMVWEIATSDKGRHEGHASLVVSILWPLGLLLMVFAIIPVQLSHLVITGLKGLFCKTTFHLVDRNWYGIFG